MAERKNWVNKHLLGYTSNKPSNPSPLRTQTMKQSDKQYLYKLESASHLAVATSQHTLFSLHQLPHGKQYIGHPPKSTHHPAHSNLALESQGEVPSW